MGWVRIHPNINREYTIICFDDGNRKFENNENKWILFGRWKGKVALFNKQNPKIVISSISSWKIVLFK